MSSVNSTNIFNATMYIRISKDDAEKSESQSISNQRELIKAYIKSHPEIKLCNERIDDGYSGVNFDRPAIQELFKDIKNGTINCIIVKDLSRFGRNYIETGRYIEQIFPFIGVRFIAITDHYDSNAIKQGTDNIIIPFKNLMNDAYSRDISIKVRSQIEARRKRGDYTGSFPVFGYMRSEKDKHKLVIDDYAAHIVKTIFTWKKSGINNQKIANKLNEEFIPSPLEYKELQNMAFSTSFKLNPQAKWSAMAVKRILTDEIYTGTMVQGKESTPNYKVKKRFTKPKEEWIRVVNTHEAIINKEDFELINNIMLTDTRTTPSGDELYLFSGILQCAECNSNMVRRPVTSAGKEYSYYICSGNKQSKEYCSSTHCISENNLIKIISELVKQHIDLGSEHNLLMEFIDSVPMEDNKVKKINYLIITKKDKLKTYEQLKISLYEDYKTGILSKNDYIEMKKVYEDLCFELEYSLEELNDQLNNLTLNIKKHNHLIELFKQQKNITKLTRNILVSFINKIVIQDSKNIRIYFTYENIFQHF